MTGIRLQGSYSQMINRYGKPDSKTTVDVSYNALGLKGELNAASRIWVLHILEPNKPVTKNDNGIGNARKDIQIGFGKPDQTNSDDADYIWDSYFVEKRICFYGLHFKYKKATETVSSVNQAMDCA